MINLQKYFCVFLLSPSPRRAWIEINGTYAGYYQPGSPSPRSAWIEIYENGDVPESLLVALPSEGVD